MHAYTDMGTFMFIDVNMLTYIFKIINFFIAQTYPK